jgi:hypothetical protein
VVEVLVVVAVEVEAPEVMVDVAVEVAVPRLPEKVEVATTLPARTVVGSGSVLTPDEAAAMYADRG